MKRIIAVCAALLLSTTASPALAQTLQHQGEPTGGVSSSLIVDSTTPVLYQCSRALSETCFRIYFEIKPRQSGEVLVGYIRSGGGIYETRAFAGTGATCESRFLGGLPEAHMYTNGDIHWDGTPFAASAVKPATYMLEFNCDGRLVAGDQVTVQITLGVDPTGRGERIARYVFPRLALAASPR